ncbi:MAG: metallophosphoesterase [Alloprevotella sp.]|nr:metallophosphoesterase [Alloprevotella sp.]
MIARILPVLLFLLLIPLGIIDICWLRKQEKQSVRRLVWILNIIVCIALIILSISESFSTTADLVKQIVMSISICLIVPQTVMALFAGIGHFIKNSRWHRILKYFAIFLSIVCLSSVIYGLTIGPAHIQTRTIEYRQATIPPKFSNYKIVLFSDLHTGSFRHRTNIIEKIVQRINEQKADLVVFTGDIINYREKEIEPFSHLLQSIRAKDGVIAVLGNHDYLGYYNFESDALREAEFKLLKERIRSWGWTLLLNESKTIVRDSDSIAIIGLENTGNRPNFPKYAHIDKARKDINPSTFQILLEHDPSYWSDSIVSLTNIPLTLSGHTHAMQLQIGPWSPAKWFYPEWAGLYTSKSGQTLYVTPGVGEVFLPFRLGAWPELDVILLNPSD